MKKLLFMVIGFMFAVQTAFASPTGDRMDLEILNKSDAQILFQNNDMTTQQVIFLNENQMGESKAKGWWGRHVTSNLRRARKEVQRFLGRIDRSPRGPANVPARERTAPKHRYYRFFSW
jgi:hypothetical protein